MFLVMWPVLSLGALEKPNEQERHEYGGMCIV